jgi:hypothetical protein
MVSVAGIHLEPGPADADPAERAVRFFAVGRVARPWVGKVRGVR